MSGSCCNEVAVGEYFADLLVDDALLVALKTVKAPADAHRMQCTNCLKASSLRPCLALTFSKPRLEIKRVANGLRTAPDHLRVPRASARICVEILSSPAAPQARNAGRDRTCSQPLTGGGSLSSSCRLERATCDPAAFRFVAGNAHSDHDTVATFRPHFRKQIEALFV